MKDSYSIFDTQIGLDQYMRRFGNFNVDQLADLSILNTEMIGSNDLLSTAFSSPTLTTTIVDGELPAILSYGKKTFSSTAAGYIMGLDTDGKYKWSIGDSISGADWAVTTPATFTVRGTIVADSGLIGGWYINSTTLSSGAVESTSNILLDSSNGLIRVGSSASQYITVDGSNLRLRSSNYAADISGFSISPSFSEFENVKIRGTLSTVSFKTDSTSSIGGRVLVSKGADVLDADVSITDVAITLRGESTVAVNDIIRISEGGVNEWLKVTSIASAPTYSVTRNANTTVTASTFLNGYWKMDENTGGTTADSSGNGTTLTLGSTSWVAGKISYALDFDGTTSYAAANNNTYIQDLFDNGGTVSVWIKPTGVGENNFGRIYDKGAVRIYLGGLSGVACLINFDQFFSTTTGQWQTSTRPVIMNQWNHIVLVYKNNTVTEDPKIFVNGVSITITEVTTPVGTRTSDAAYQLVVGNRAATDRTFAGTIDELRFYNTMLTGDEIDAIYAIDIPTTAPAWKAGTAIVNYGQSGQGYLDFAASPTDSPYLRVLKHSGSPWSDSQVNVQIGQLKDKTNKDEYGIWIRSGAAYIGGLRLYDAVVGLDGAGDYSTIQDAIDSLPTTGGTIFIRNGTYTITSVISVNKANITIIGENYKNTIVKIGDSTNIDAFDITVGDFRIKNLQIDGNRTNNSSSGNGLDFSNAGDNLLVEQCYIHEMTSSCLYIGGSNSVSILSNILLDSDGPGISFSGSASSENLIAHNIIKGCSSGIGGFRNAGLVISNNIVESNTTYGIVLAESIGGTNDVTITGNSVRLNGSHGIYANLMASGSIERIIISNNLIASNTGSGIEIYAPYRFVITGNNISMNSQHGISTVADECSIVSNLIYDNGYHGIYLNTAKYNTITGNTLIENGSASTYFNIYAYNTSTDNIISSNIMKAVSGVDYNYREAAAADDRNIITSNRATGADVANISIQGASSISANNIVT